MKKIIKITFLFLFVILSCGCGKVNVSVDSKSLFYMDTYIQVKLYDCANSEEIFNKIDNIYKEYHELTDRYNSYDGIINVYYLNNVTFTQNIIGGKSKTFRKVFLYKNIAK